MPVRVPIVVLPHARCLALPEYQTLGSAGCDVRAAIEEPLALEPGGRQLVPCGIRMAIPHGWEVQVRPRSGLAWRHGVTMVNPPGTIDSDYRGELFVPLINHGSETYVLERGERIAQLVLAPVHQIAWQVTDTLEHTERGEGGFGSTGSQ